MGLICCWPMLGQDASSGQTGNTTSKQPASQETVDRLSAELAAALARIKTLEEKSGGAPSSAPSATNDSAPATVAGPQNGGTPPAAAATEQAPMPTPDPAPSEDMGGHDHMMTVPGGPELHIRGFFDFDFDKGPVAQQLEYPVPVTANSSFRAGEFDLFITSQLSEKLSFLTEAVFSTNETNVWGIDMERFQLTYRPSRYFQISGGRFHTDFGYYNTAFHHGTWFSTATGRPFMYFFEDGGGPLPVHEVGITTTGAIPGLDKLNLHWTAEIGDGSSEWGSPLYGDGVENFVSDRNRKDVNFAIYAKPEVVPGLQVGGSFLNGELLPYGTTLKVNQNISSFYVVYINEKWEILNEAVLMQHHIDGGGPTYNSPMGYTQAAYRFGKTRPYFRFQEVNIPNNDPSTSFKGRYEGPSVGIRMDFFEYACLKFQYNRVYLRNAAAQNGFEAQMAFTF